MAFTGPILLTNMSVWITVGLTAEKNRKLEFGVYVLGSHTSTFKTFTTLIPIVLSNKTWDSGLNLHLSAIAKGLKARAGGLRIRHNPVFITVQFASVFI